MATWMAHLRIAEKLLEIYPGLDRKSFLVGNIGPDAGVPNEDYSEFSPPKTISHWYDAEGNVDAEDFYRKYLADTSGYSKEELSFYLGYYVHLLSDIEWRKLYEKKLEEPLYKDNLAKDPRFIWTIKEDWYGQDSVYLMEHPDNVFHKDFVNIREFPNKFLDFFPAEAFTISVKRITHGYLTAVEDPSREFKYLTKQEMNAYIAEATEAIKEVLGVQAFLDEELCG